MRIAITDVGVVNERSLDGFNPELADQGNPEGAFFKDVLVIMCNTAEGRKFALIKEFECDDFDAAEEFAIRVLNHSSINPKLWIEQEAVYGSPAWIEQDQILASAGLCF